MSPPAMGAALNRILALGEGGRGGEEPRSVRANRFFMLSRIRTLGAERAFGAQRRTA